VNGTDFMDFRERQRVFESMAVFTQSDRSLSDPTRPERLAVLHQTGVERVVSFNRTPALIPDAEIAALRRAVECELPLGPWPYLKAGQRVRIEKGVLAGIEGTLARESTGWRVVVSVAALQRSIAVEVDRDMIDGNYQAPK